MWLIVLYIDLLLGHAVHCHAITRIEIRYALQDLSNYTPRPRGEHRKIFKRILRFTTEFMHSLFSQPHHYSPPLNS